jgi:hypothetical protein
VKFPYHGSYKSNSWFWKMMYKRCARIISHKNIYNRRVMFPPQQLYTLCTTKLIWKWFSLFFVKKKNVKCVQLLCKKRYSQQNTCCMIASASNRREMIKILTLYNNDTTPRHNGVGPTHGPHSIVPWCCTIVV